MEKGTFWLDWRKGGKVTLGKEDYDVEFFGGGDHEMLYTMDAENREKLTAVLSRTHKGSLEQMIEMEFGIHLDKKNLRKWLDENRIEYKFFSWTSYD